MTAYYLINSKPAITGRVERCRSFTYRLNCEKYDPTLRYEHRDFFASYKAECDAEDAEQVSAELYEQCRREVLADVKEYIRLLRRKDVNFSESKGAA